MTSNVLARSFRSFRRAKGMAATAACLALLAALALLPTTSEGVSAHPSTAHARQPKPTVVLIHGAWADSSSWNGVVQRLQDAGYTVDTPPNPLRGLPYDSTYIADYLGTISGPIILVGHSYGGAVITNAATGNLNVKALVYVDAFIPDQGETVGQLNSAQPGSCLGGDPTSVFNVAPYPGAPSGDVDLYVKQSVFPGCIANDLPARQGAVLASTQRPLALSTFSEASGAPAWKSIPSWALIGTIDRAIPPAELRFMAQRAHAHIVEVRASHLSMISQPDAVTALIIAAATATAS
jgi:pimeloyl-ACP methyl ester carboxylesterase